MKIILNQTKRYYNIEEIKHGQIFRQLKYNAIYMRSNGQENNAIAMSDGIICYFKKSEKLVILNDAELIIND